MTSSLNICFLLFGRRKRVHCWSLKASLSGERRRSSSSRTIVHLVQCHHHLWMQCHGLCWSELVLPQVEQLYISCNVITYECSVMAHVDLSWYYHPVAHTWKVTLGVPTQSHSIPHPPTPTPTRHNSHIGSACSTGNTALLLAEYMVWWSHTWSIWIDISSCFKWLWHQS